MSENSRIAVVGNGPSAEGKGPQIDACDFIVRIKQYWRFGAEGVGEKIDAWAWYGSAVRDKPLAREHWITQSVREFERRERTKQSGFTRLRCIAEAAAGGPVRFIQDDMVQRLSRYLGAFASTGLRAIAMALERQPGEIVIAGFDALTKDDTDARGDRRPPCHNLLAEKQALCELEVGRWLGKRCTTRLTWLGRPSQLGRNA